MQRCNLTILVPLFQSCRSAPFGSVAADMGVISSLLSNSVNRDSIRFHMK